MEEGSLASSLFVSFPPATADAPLRPSLLFLGGVLAIVWFSKTLGGPRPLPLTPNPQTFLTHPFLFQVPQIYWELSTKRVLLMEFLDGGQVNDRDYMERNKIDVNEVRLSAHGFSCTAAEAELGLESRSA